MTQPRQTGAWGLLAICIVSALIAGCLRLFIGDGVPHNEPRARVVTTDGGR